MGKADIRGQTVALAGLFQAVKLVQQVAGGQPRDEAAIRACFTGVFNTDPDAAERVFGELPGLQLGLQTLRAQLGPGRDERDIDITRHAVTVLYLERKLSRNRDMLQRVRAGIDRAYFRFRFRETEGGFEVIGGERVEGQVYRRGTRRRGKRPLHADRIGQFLLERLLASEEGVTVEVRGFDLDTLALLAGQAADAMRGWVGQLGRRPSGDVGERG